MDEPRLLHVHSEHGYTGRTFDAMPHEPEAVSAAYQRHLTARSKQSNRERVVAEWQPHYDAILDQLRIIEQLPVDTNRELRAIVRHLERVDRQVRRGLT